MIDSSDVGIRKPDPRIYEELIDRVGEPAESIVFVDDLSKNLPAAASLGINTVLFRGPTELAATPESLGVRVATR